MKLLKPDSPATSIHPLNPRQRLRPTDFLILAVAAVHWPLGIMAKNHWQLVHPERVIIMIAAVAALASLVAWVWVKLGGDRRTVVFTVFIGTLFLMRGGPLLWEYGTLTGWLIMLAAVGIAGYVGHRLVDSPVLGIVTVSLAVLLGSGPLVNGISNFQVGASQVVNSERLEVELAERPDVFVILLDGYPGSIALQHEFGLSNSSLTSSLRDAGYQVPASVWTPYWSTERAIPAVVDMSYPTPAVEDLTPATVQALHGIVGGDSNMLKVFSDNGYETTMLESGWVGSSCGPAFDNCLTSAWFDEFGFMVAFETAFTQQLVSQLGDSFSVNSLRTMTTLKELVAAPDSDTPQFVFAHVVAPHGPYLLDENCEVDGSMDRILASTFATPLREEAVSNFVYHKACVDRFVLEFAELVDDDDVVLFVGDHGSDRRKDLLDGVDSDPAGVIERMNPFVAAHIDESCDIGDTLLTSNLLRRVLSCYSQTPIPDIPERMFLPGDYELSDAEVRLLLEEATFVSADGSMAQGGG